MSKTETIHAPSLLAAVRTDIVLTYPAPLVDALLNSFEQIHRQYDLGRHEPSELNGGKFCEALIRVLQFERDGTFVPLGTHIPDMPGKFRQFESVTGLAESVRLLIPGLGAFLYRLRDKRGVGHLPADISPNEMDASAVVSTADWILAELLRLHYKCKPEQAQRIVNALVERPPMLVYKIGEVRRVLNPQLSYKEQVLVLLSTEHPHSVPDVELLKWTEHSNPTVFKRDVLRPLHKRRMIEYERTGQCTILPPGQTYVEANLPKWLESRVNSVS